MERGRASGKGLYAAPIAIFATLALVGCGASLLPKQTQTSNGAFKTYANLKSAYVKIVPGRTPASQLSKIGFDSTAPNVEVLSYLGVIDRFMPRDSVKFDNLAAPVRACILARDRCRAYVFRPSLIEAHRTGDTMLDVLGFDRTTVNEGWSAEVTVLVQDGRVAYKLMSGKPNIQQTEERVQPLGPLQDVGGTIVPAEERVTP